MPHSDHCVNANLNWVAEIVPIVYSLLIRSDKLRVILIVRRSRIKYSARRN